MNHIHVEMVASSVIFQKVWCVMKIGMAQIMVLPILTTLVLPC